MSFFSLLLFASAFYFAHGRPDTVPVDQVVAPDVPPAQPTGTNVQPTVDVASYQEQADGFLQAMEDAIDKYMTPIISKLDTSDQEMLKTMALNEISSFFNYIVLMYKDKIENPSTTGDWLNKEGNILIEFEALEVLDKTTGFLPAIPEAQTNQEENVKPVVGGV